MRAVEDIEREIRALDPLDQERLLRALLEELDAQPDDAIDKAWLEEARRRGAEIDSGAVEAISMDEAIDSVLAELDRP